MFIAGHEKAKLHPSSVYASPIDLLEDNTLSKTRKLSLFESWKTDVKRVLQAALDDSCVSINEDICREELLEELNNCLDLLNQA